MPPRRTKRVKTSKVSNEVNEGIITDAAPLAVSIVKVGEGAQAEISVNNGKCKFIDLPAELLLEIVSFFPAVHIPTSRRFNTPVLPPSIFERWDVLRALSQTCRLWRNIFFPMLWERMEACAIRQ